MNMKTKFSILTLGIFLTIVWYALSQGEEYFKEETMTIDILSQKADSFSLKNASVEDAVTRLRGLGFRVCFEDIERSRKKEQQWEEVLLSLDLHGKSVENVLNVIITKAPDYTWKRQENTDIINIFPKKGSTLNWKIPVLTAKEEPFIDLIEKHDVLDLKKHGILLFYRGFSQPVRVPISIDLKDKPVMECLNALINSVPRLCWTIKTNPHGKRVLFLNFAIFDPRLEKLEGAKK